MNYILDHTIHNNISSYKIIMNWVSEGTHLVMNTPKYYFSLENRINSSFVILLLKINNILLNLFYQLQL